MRVIIRAMAVGVAVAASGCAQLAAGSAVGLASARAPLAGTWRVAFTVKGSGQPSFTAVTVSGSGHAWAFDTVAGKAPGAYQLSGSAWRKRSFPAMSGDVVLAASSSSAGNVWAFTFDGRALRFDGTSWALMKKFRRQIGAGLAISKSDVWVFGAPGAPALGTWHFDGSRWSQSASGKGLFGASALSARNVWAFGSTSVAHWNGTAWTRTSVASVLPKDNQFCSSHLTAIFAATARSVYAVATGGCQDQGGPFVLLHYNGATWTRLALVSKLGAPEAVIPDGHGGLWIPVLTGFPGDGSMEHYVHGKLGSARLPITPPHLALFAAASGPNGATPLAAGYSRKSFSAPTTTAVVLRFAP